MSTLRLPGRGTQRNPPNRFETLLFEPDPGDPGTSGPESDLGDDEPAPPPTAYYRDASRSILASNDSPDIPFRWSLNPYRGCEHGCIYCYARPSHETLGFNAGLDFERRLLIKDDAPGLLRRALDGRSWRPEVIALSGNTDCYQPVERRLRLTRQCLEVLLEYRNPVSVITKSALVTRDVDLLGPLAAFGAAHVNVSVTTLDAALARRMEPRAASPERRLEAISRLAAAGIPVGVMLAPVIPGLNDSEIPRILAAAAASGARSASWVLLRLAHPIDDLFLAWLEEHVPERRARIVHHVRETRGGAISDSAFGRRMRGTGEYARQIAALFDASARRHGLAAPLPGLDGSHFRRPDRPGAQLRLL